jgi:hypothetical protein
LLAFHETAYTIYAALIISVVAWFGYNLTREEKAKLVVRIPLFFEKSAFASYDDMQRFLDMMKRHGKVQNS